MYGGEALPGTASEVYRRPETIVESTEPPPMISCDGCWSEEFNMVDWSSSSY